jgi:large subunit ribosomal protein L9
MNVILLEKIGKLGEIGDTASVKAGYARNFLFPKGKAIPATKANLAEFEERRADLLAAHNKKVAASQARAAKVDGANLIIEVNASDEGKLFGSVGTREIAVALNAQAGSDVSKAEVLMPHGVLRELGITELTIDLGHDVAAQITVNVVGLQSAADVSADGSIIEEVDDSDSEAAKEAREGSDDDSSEEADEAES